MQPPAEHPLRCGECDAPVDGVQRYCIVCGARQTHVEDPVARYMAQASARRRELADPAPGSGGGLTIGRAILVICLPLAVLVGALAGRASNTGDAAIIAALHARASPTVTVSAIGSAIVAGRAGSRAVSSSTATHRRRRTARVAPAGIHHAVSTTPSAHRHAESAQTVKRIRKSAGSGYVSSQQGLPNSISVP
jgi:hypothetical protein